MKTVKREECTNIAMTSGGEDKRRYIVDDGVLKEWVGIGWISLGRATAADKKKYGELE